MSGQSLSRAAPQRTCAAGVGRADATARAPKSPPSSFPPLPPPPRTVVSRPSSCPGHRLRPLLPPAGQRDAPTIQSRGHVCTRPEGNPTRPEHSLLPPSRRNSRDGALAIMQGPLGMSLLGGLGVTGSRVHGGMDSSDSEDLTSEEDDTDASRHDLRGRQPTQRHIGSQTRDGKGTETFITRQGSGQSLSSNSRRSSPAKLYERRTFTRSRSPAVKPPSDGAANGLHRPGSPSLFSRNRQHPAVAIRSLFPSTVCIHVRLPGTRYKLSFDTRQALENILLLCSVGYAAVKIRGFATSAFDPDMWISIGDVNAEPSLVSARSPFYMHIELALLVIASIVYCTWTRVSWIRISPSLPERPPTPPSRPSSPRLPEGREGRRPLQPQSLSNVAAPRSRDTGYVWMTVPKNYRYVTAPSLGGLLA